MIQTNLLNLLHPTQHQTPIKKNKDAFIVQPKTAESQHKEVSTLESMQAKELFEHFQKIVKITVQQDAQFDNEQETNRKLDYLSSVNKVKLQFSPKTLSMKKSERICFKSKNEQKIEGTCLFDICDSQKERKMDQKEVKLQKQKNMEEKFTTPNPKEKGPNELLGWATRKQLDYSD